MFRDMGSVQRDVEASLREAATTHIRDEMQAGEYVAWLAYPADEPQRVVGGTGVQLRRLLPRPEVGGARVLVGREGIVLYIFVYRDYRREGVAPRLIDSILAWVPGTDIVRLVLHASPDGRPLYESLGFVQTNEMRYARTLRP